MTETKLVSKALQVERLDNGHRKLLRDLVVKVNEENITIPKGTHTDYSSIPWLGRMVVHWSKVDVAGVVHDFLYVNARINNKPITRRKADNVWRQVALAGNHHANFFQAWTCWFFLLVGGWYAWCKYRKN